MDIVYITVTEEAASVNIEIVEEEAIVSIEVAEADTGGGAWGDITGTLADQTDLQAALNAKANALGLDDNYVTDAEKEKLANLSGMNTGDQDLSGKVDKVAGKGLSTNDYTNTDKAKVDATSGTNTGDQDLSGLQPTSAKDASGGYAGLTLFKINFKNALNTITSWFTNANTVARTYLFPDKDGTVAMLDDILAAGVPYTGATDDVDLGTHHLEAKNVHVKGTFSNYNEDAMDMGAEQTSDLRGYGSEYITDKSLNNVWIGANGRATTGGIRVVNGVFQMYLNGAWADVVTNFTMREDATFGYTLEHKPIGFSQWIEVMTGQSLNNLGLNGYPITNAYKTSMGAYPYIPQLGGRTI